MNTVVARAVANIESEAINKQLMTRKWGDNRAQIANQQLNILRSTGMRSFDQYVYC